MFMERKRFNQEGYSLIEVMIAIGIFSIGLLPQKVTDQKISGRSKKTIDHRNLLCYENNK